MFLDDQFLIKRRRAGKGDFSQKVESSFIHFLFRVSRPMKADSQARKCFRGPIEVSSFGFLLRGLFRSHEFVTRFFPTAIIFLDILHQLIVVIISSHENNGIIRSVKALSVELAVFKLVGHIQDIIEIAYNSVFVRVLFKSSIPQNFVNLAAWIGNAAVVFSFYNRGFCFEHFFGVVEIDEYVSLELYDFLQVFSSGKNNVIAGVIV